MGIFIFMTALLIGTNVLNTGVTSALKDNSCKRAKYEARNCSKEGWSCQKINQHTEICGHNLTQFKIKEE